MSTRQKRIYLGRHGRVFGPYDRTEFEKLTADGRIDDYNWIWDDGAGGWKPLDPPPPPPETGSPAGVREDLSVLCLYRQVPLPVDLRAVTETGCQILHASRAAAPALAPGGTVMLNLLDPASGKSMNVRARVQDVSRGKEGWTYRCRWERRPELLAA